VGPAGPAGPAGAPGPANVRLIQVENCIGSCNGSCATGEVVASAICLSAGPAVNATVTAGQGGVAWQVSCPIGSGGLIGVCVKK
jgi:hypothetical protein